jgi:superfamily II DNA or RNA helicase
MASVTQLISSLSPNEQVRGRQFESVCKWFLENDPEYKRVIRRVWLWKNWPGRWGRDKGIDLVAETYNKELWAIQSKAYAVSHSVTKHDIDKFLSESSRKVFSYRLLIATAWDLGHNAKEVLEGQEKSVGTLFFSDLKKRKLNWPSSPQKLSSKQKPPKKLRPDQRRAVADVLRKFRLHDRGQLIRACGTGKTLIGLRIAEAMKSQRTLVLVPSLSLVSQILSEWTKDGARPFTFLPVCSDETVGREDHLVSHVRELGVPATTKVAEIAEFLQGPGTKVVFSTYQSSPKLALAFKKHSLKPFDLAVADEAHRCAGANAGDAVTILDSKAIPARKRLFMTATPRIASEATKARADSLGINVISMDNVEHFGPVFHELKFSDAIRLKLLTDYCVEIIGVDDPMYKRYAEEGVFVTLDGKTVTDARTLTSHIALAKAIKKHDLRRIITFHGRVDRAGEFAEQFPKFSRWMPKADRPRGEFWSSLVSGKMSSSKRDAILDRLREVQPPERAIVTNARCLSEGVDVQALDGVAFIDPKESQVDIIQAVGRAIRRAERKEKGVIILPVYISSNEDEEEALEHSSFKHVWRVLRALRAHDDELANQLDGLRAKLGKEGKIRISLPPKISIHLPTNVQKSFAEAFYLRTVKAVSRLPALTIDEILRWADEHHQATGQWPNVMTGAVLGAPGETWRNIHGFLYSGGRGLQGGISLAQLLAEKRGYRNHRRLPVLTVAVILKWADAHRHRTGRWPKENSGRVFEAPTESWSGVALALSRGGRGLPGASSLASLLAEKRGVRNPQNLPVLTIQRVLRWADAHHRRTGRWPNRNSGEVVGAPGEKWANIDAALHRGGRGLPAGSTIAQLLLEQRGARGPKTAPLLTVDQILEWADAHHRKTGRWPNGSSGEIVGVSGEKWSNISTALKLGLRGLTGGTSLAEFLEKHRHVPNRRTRPDLAIDQILEWADAHNRRTGRWPTKNSDEVLGAAGERWPNIHAALSQGLRGLPGGSTLANLLEKKRGVRNRFRLQNLELTEILKWADAHRQRTGNWPTQNSGEVLGAPGEKWQSIYQALRFGRRGLPAGLSLGALLAKHRGVRNKSALPKLTTAQIVEWADAHHQRTGKWPTKSSGEVYSAPGETWSGIRTALRNGIRGLPGGSSLAELLQEQRGVRHSQAAPQLTVEQILEWADAHRRETGLWPRVKSGEVRGAPGEKWANINAALESGGRGLRKNSSLAKLLTEKRGVHRAKTTPA